MSPSTANRFLRVLMRCLRFRAKDTWTVILNKNPNQGGTGQYKQDLDLLRLTVKPEAVPHRERLTFLFADKRKIRRALIWNGKSCGCRFR